jgi:transcriptional regulator with XRE-family HTH domain
MGRRIKHLREQQGLSQRALAARARVSPGLIAQLELGLTRDVVTAVAQRLAKALGVPVGKLLE